MIIIDLAQAVWLAKRKGLKVEPYVRQIEEAMEVIGLLLAEEYDVEVGPARVEEPEFAGACIGFRAKRKGQKCPKDLQELDQDGEMEL